MPAVSRHLKVLEHAALISRTRSGTWRTSHLEAFEKLDTTLLLQAVAAEFDV